MPKSRLEMNLAEGAGSGVVAQPELLSNELPEVLQLRSQLQFIQEQISKKTVQLVEKEQEFCDFAEALNLIKTESRWTPKPGELAPFDLLRGILEESKNSQERQERLRVADQVLTLTRQAYSELQDELTRLRQSLVNCEQRLAWELKYGANLERYRHSFDWGASYEQRLEIAQQERDRQIQEMEQSIHEKQQRLALAQGIISKALSQNEKPSWTYQFASPEHVCETYLEAIAQLQQLLQELRLQPLDVKPGTPKAALEKPFREYVQARSEIENPLKKLIEAQSGYIRALEEFRVVAQRNPKGLEFRVDDLPESPRQVVLDGRDRIILEK